MSRKLIQERILKVQFDPQLTAEQVEKTLTALADYFRACGGIGFAVEDLEAGDWDFR